MEASLPGFIFGPSKSVFWLGLRTSQPVSLVQFLRILSSQKRKDKKKKIRKTLIIWKKEIALIPGEYIHYQSITSFFLTSVMYV